MSSTVELQVPALSSQTFTAEITGQSEVKQVPDVYAGLLTYLVEKQNDITPDLSYNQLSISVHPYSPDDDTTGNPKISVSLTKISKTPTARFTFKPLNIKGICNPAAQTVFQFCPIDLIKSCFGSGHWIEYRPWLENEAWKEGK